METVSYEMQARKIINSAMKSGVKKFAVYSYVKQGQLVRKMLSCEFNMEPEYIIDNYLCNGKNIVSVNEFFKKRHMGECILFCCDSLKYRETLKSLLNRQMKKEQVIDVFPENNKYADSITDEGIEKAFRTLENCLFAFDNNILYQNRIAVYSENSLEFAKRFEQFLEERFKNSDVCIRRAYSLEMCMLIRHVDADPAEALAGKAQYRRVNHSICLIT